MGVEHFVCHRLGIGSNHLFKYKLSILLFSEELVNSKNEIMNFRSEMRRFLSSHSVDASCEWRMQRRSSDGHWSGESLPFRHRTLLLLFCFFRKYNKSQLNESHIARVRASACVSGWVCCSHVVWLIYWICLVICFVTDDETNTHVRCSFGKQDEW